jgi:hypothetical protein
MVYDCECNECTSYMYGRVRARATAILALSREPLAVGPEFPEIEVKETFGLVEVAPAVAEQSVKRLSGVPIRGRRVTARVDRGS